MKSQPVCQYSGSGVTFRVTLPELTDDFEGTSLPPEMIERAAQAVFGALGQRIEVFIDGEDKPPAIVDIDPWDVENADDWTIDG